MRSLLRHSVLLQILLLSALGLTSEAKPFVIDLMREIANDPEPQKLLARPSDYAIGYPLGELAEVVRLPADPSEPTDVVLIQKRFAHPDYSPRRTWYQKIPLLRGKGDLLFATDTDQADLALVAFQGGDTVAWIDGKEGRILALFAINQPISQLILSSYVSRSEPNGMNLHRDPVAIIASGDELTLIQLGATPVLVRSHVKLGAPIESIQTGSTEPISRSGYGDIGNQVHVKIAAVGLRLQGQDDQNVLYFEQGHFSESLTASTLGGRVIYRALGADQIEQAKFRPQVTFRSCNSSF